MEKKICMHASLLELQTDKRTGNKKVALCGATWVPTDMFPWVTNIPTDTLRTPTDTLRTCVRRQNTYRHVSVGCKNPTDTYGHLRTSYGHKSDRCYQFTNRHLFIYLLIYSFIYLLIYLIIYLFIYF